MLISFTSLTRYYTESNKLRLVSNQALQTICRMPFDLAVWLSESPCLTHLLILKESEIYQTHCIFHKSKTFTVGKCGRGEKCKEAD